MSLFSVDVNGATVVVDAPSKTAAGAYGNRIAKVGVRPAGAADLHGVDMANIPILIKGGVTQAEADASEAAKAEKASSGTGKPGRPKKVVE